ncbi:MAG: hypothetical protein DMF98_28450 [Acidobacteria bacterium]|nr:MAG: hypothetical protein DMF98_28450 [Acidobacteriota bacterium]
MLRHACSAWDAWVGSSNPIASSGRTPVAAAIVLHRFMPVMTATGAYERAISHFFLFSKH